MFLVSCGNSVALSESTPTVATGVVSAETSYTTAPLSSTDSTCFSTTETISTTIAQTQLPTTTSLDDFELQIIGDYQSTREIPFEKLYTFSKNYRANGKWYTEVSVVEPIQRRYIFSKIHSGGLVPMVVTVAGYADVKNPNYAPINTAEYFVYRNSCGDYVSDGKLYTMETDGYPEEPVYGCYRIDIGEKYVTFLSGRKYGEIVDDDLGKLHYLFKVVEIDDTEWVYPTIGYDFSSLKCAVRITDETERLFYKPGKDDDIIKYLKMNDIPNPIIEYKCELNAYIEEMLNVDYVDVDNFTPVGEYTSILDAFPFESFAEYPENMRKNRDDPYTPKEIIDVAAYESKYVAGRDTIVKIIGYRNSEIGNDGMLYSYYYVYACPKIGQTPEFYDKTVYIMQAYGSPSHPYYGQRRIEIGDMYLRLDTDASFYQTDEIIPATKMFYLETYENDIYGASPRVYPDFGTDFSNIKSVNEIEEFEKYVYKEGRDDDIIAYMEENNIKPPVYRYKKYLVFFTIASIID